MLCDLNVPWPVNDYDTQPTTEQINNLKSILKTLYSFQYTHIAINFIVNKSIKFPNDSNLINPIKLNKYFPEFLKLKNFKIFTRITIIIDDPSQSQGISKISQYFDIISVRPISEKALIMSINLEINLISLELNDKLPCYLKHKTIGSAIEKGIYFEIIYNSLINSNSNNFKKTFLSNIKSLIRASRSKGMITTSGALKSIDIRNSIDLIQLFKFLGLNSNISKKTFDEWPLKILLNSRLRLKSYKQVIGLIGENEENLIDNKCELNDDDDNSKNDGSLYIKKRVNDSLIQRQLKKSKN